jgi:histidine triad (HIT) family protein
MTNCIFCKIANGEIPASKVYEDKDVVAFLDIDPVNKGHTLVIPKKHYATIMDLPNSQLHKLMDIVKKVASVMIVSEESGVNVQQNNKSAAGQLVHHVHFHVIPRHKGDGHEFDWDKHKYADAAEEAQYQKGIADALKKI